jgi:hypothetical protein
MQETSMRRLALALPLALALACTQDPPGRCEGDLDCLAGQICQEGVCARLETDGQIGSLCARDGDCVAWGECLSNACTLREGACEEDLHCDPWQVCDVGLHACTTAPGGCEDETWCGYWQDCVAYRCETGPGYCGDDRPCEDWQICDAGHLCQTAPGYCADDGDCKAWQTCGPQHVCATAGTCTTSADCAGWESCDAGGACAPAISCTDGSECVAGDVCSSAFGSGFCTVPVALDPAAVHLLGTFLDGSGAVDAVAALSSPTRFLVGFSAGVGPTARIAPDATLVYERVSTGRLLHRFVPDALEWDAVGGAWRLPADPFANDVQVATPGCADVGEWVMQAGTGEVRYACAADPTVWYGTSAATPIVSGYRVLSWDFAERMLAVRTVDDTLVVLDASLAETVVSGAPALTGHGLTAVRTHAGGFWLALVPPSLTETRRWTVDGSGAFTDDGAYAAAPAELSAGPPAVLDATGALMVSGVRVQPDPDPPQDVVLRCEIEPGGCALAYDEADATAQDWSATPPELYLLSEGSPLATGP